MEDKTLEILQKISENTENQSIAVVAVSVLCFACFFGYLFYKVFTCIYESGEEEGKKSEK